MSQDRIETEANPQYSNEDVQTTLHTHPSEKRARYESPTMEDRCDVLENQLLKLTSDHIAALDAMKSSLQNSYAQFEVSIQNSIQISLQKQLEEGLQLIFNNISNYVISNLPATSAPANMPVQQVPVEMSPVNSNSYANSTNQSKTNHVSANQSKNSNVNSNLSNTINASNRQQHLSQS